ncbi:type VI secretion system baseplate subunit TssG [Moraxella bovis]|uniref:Type VI secretion system baseplate subunit TssG n=1 Tax=Moraxella bovis TaxID=476 RepID=A0AAQ2SZC0_MORBO|nr:type VI secretion system baseplate subunit TssG [Moraxella bovis]AWY19334.1 type VI secretion system baseplate subunit TssG [Moraxella bovis]OOR88907.1 hypothetical protein B0182_08375 [Moraxella bovis]UYZ76044.1 type VI secretion system baseplate subunit TssG [Moraxella bovis]UYZ78003.1 type VI secretion system baseplate subunit TssG [Moraxella bovis]UYZ80897.1 type VI secretion system baseplate subunit TssG [Moraxella bovis]
MSSDISVQAIPLNTDDMQLFALLRYLHLHANLTKNIGDEVQLTEHNVRFGQLAKLSFQERQVHQIISQGKFLKVKIKGFGMLGTNGALPLHLSEAIYEKNLHEKDHTFNDFLDIFHHRLISLFYKAWLSSEPAVMLDNKSNPLFSEHIAGFVGNQPLADEGMEGLLKYSQFYYSSLLLNQNMPTHNLIEILSGYFDTPIQIEENVGEWIPAEAHTTTLSSQLLEPLGSGLLIGTHYFDATQKFRVIIGPVSTAKYLDFLKGGHLFDKLIRWVVRYTKHSYQFDIKIIVDKDDIRPSRLDTSHPLGRNSWLGQPKENPHVIIDID